jgi:hypothetical protein
MAPDIRDEPITEKIIAETGQDIEIGRLPAYTAASPQNVSPGWRHCRVTGYVNLARSGGTGRQIFTGKRAPQCVTSDLERETSEPDLQGRTYA